MPVLITAACHAEAYRIEQLIQAKEVVFADHQKPPVFSSRKILKIPKGNSPSFAHEVLTLCLDHQVTRVFPLYRDEIIALSEAKLLFEEFDISIIAPSVNWLRSYDHKQDNKPSNLVIFEKGQVIAGDLPPGYALPEEEATGIFSRTEQNDPVNYHLYSIAGGYL